MKKETSKSVNKDQGRNHMGNEGDWGCFSILRMLSVGVSTHGHLEFTVQKTGGGGWGGTYTEKPFVHITYIHANHKDH